MRRAVTIPNGWKNTSLGEIFEFKNGVNAAKSSYGQGIKFINVMDILQGNFILAEKISGQISLPDKKIKGNLVVKGDVLFNRTSEIPEEIAMTSVYLDGEKVVFGGFVIKGHPKDDSLDNMFKKYCFFSENVRKEIIRRGQGAVRTNIGQKDLSKVLFILPPLPEQKAIADLLSTWDEAIEKTERLILAKEKKLKQIARWLLFGHKRLGNKHVELTEGHFFKYPSAWRLVNISKIAKEVSVRNGQSEETVLSCSKYDGFVNSLDYFGKQVFSSDTSNYKVIKKDQFGYPSNHVEEGSIGLLEHCDKGIVSPIYVVFEVMEEEVLPLYLFKLLKTDTYRHIFQVSTSSSVDRRGSLRWREFSKIKVLFPPLEEQQQIANTLSAGQQEIDLLKQLAEKYKTQKRGLMQKMLIGTWRVKPEIVNGYMEA